MAAIRARLFSSYRQDSRARSVLRGDKNSPFYLIALAPLFYLVARSSESADARTKRFPIPRELI
jgi:hypothetical protein